MKFYEWDPHVLLLQFATLRGKQMSPGKCNPRPASSGWCKLLQNYTARMDPTQISVQDVRAKPMMFPPFFTCTDNPTSMDPVKAAAFLDLEMEGRSGQR